MECPPEAGGALQALTLAPELLPGFAGAPSSWLELTRFPGTGSAHRPVRFALERGTILDNHVAVGREKLAERCLFSASHNVRSRFGANGQGGATFFYNSHLPI
jgi:hypothetical protein